MKAAAEAATPLPPYGNDNDKDGRQTSHSGRGQRSDPTKDPKNPSHRTFSNGEVTELRLELMSFAQQVDALRATDVLVAQYDTGEIYAARAER